ncbi:hypothetical protein P168DRAFT_260038 [Aspergillus campestris IBT 28561]|uniref:Uncharacterized protein n=1 Tax=Aspergillus campestris (strain IBT 28561) TaxID=1392248 RepID=A0A2I1CSE8_ASPC2|nr:uncharacterized protein P168DRAFT_260038 [Aspergillus campestris IBT 28561]PKY00544.1 hypothetical protein P168DRAFT_260038 [Aspergillus campestris IBT 28561]
MYGIEKFRRRSTADKRTSRSDRAWSGLSGLTIDGKGNTSSDVTDVDVDFSGEYQDFKGPLGLSLLHNVPEPVVDFIFIHGLGGGSRKTWSKSPDPYHYWPKEWLSRDPEFSSVRVHSFGYKADWAERKSSFLNIQDFSLALLGEIQCSPEIRRSNAYILAREDPTLKDIASRIDTLFFLATPHRGADLAGTLTNVLKVCFGQKHFVTELERNSASLQSVDDSFRYFAHDLQLWSFYETLPSSLPLGNAIIVEKEPATLGLPKERVFLLNADHRAICKFESPTDANYKTLRNAFITTIDSIQAAVPQHTSDTSKSDYANLIALTGVSEAPIDNLIALEDRRVAGSCEWLNSREEYITWKSAPSTSRPIFWLTGDAGSGKSVLSSYVVNDLEENGDQCSYFYFSQGSANNCSITRCLLSLAFQMGQQDAAVLRNLSRSYGGSQSLEQLDERTLWRKAFLGSIFTSHSVGPHYWVIDAIDECRRLPVLLSLLSKAPSHLRIFLTSRHTTEVHQSILSNSQMVEHYSMQEQDTIADLGIYIDSRKQFLPVGDNDGQQVLKTKILERAGGSFLWTSLVVQELESVYSEEAAEEVLNEVPADMNDLYAKMLASVPPKGLRLARSLFIWTLLAMRPLSLDELKTAIKLDTGETVHNLPNVIMAICGQLIGVSYNGQVQCIHQTAKTFLLHQDVVPSLTINKSKAHSRIAELCLRSLSARFSKRAGRGARTPAASSASESDIADYAALYFSDHLQRCASEDSTAWKLLAEFLENHVLMWIEYLSQTRRLQHLTRTAKNLKAYLMRRLKHIQPFSNEKENLESWIHDLIRLNAKFRAPLTVCPSVIHSAVPALCPSESVISKTYAARPRGIILRGAREANWDDCLSRIEYSETQTSAVAYGDHYLVVAVSDGTIFLYPRDSTEPSNTLSHGERVLILVLSNDGLYLASSGPRTIRVWDTQTQTQIRSFDVQHRPLALAFADENTCLVAVTSGSYTMSWDLQSDENEEEVWRWASSFHEATGEAKPVQPPGKAILSEDCTVLAVSYRGKPIYLFDMKSESMIGSCNRSSAGAKGSQYVVDGMAFNPNPEINVLVASYGDGGIAVFDQWTAELCYQTQDVFAHTLACSPDGRMLITGSARGTIQLFEFSGARGTNLTLTYRINAFEDGIRGIAFSSDSLRFADIRGSQCRIWEPSVLVANDFDEGSQSDLSQAVTLNPRSVGMLEGPPEADITAVCLHPSGQYLFYAKQDGTVSYFDVPGATHRGVLYQHAQNIRINCIAYCEHAGLLITGDESSRILATQIKSTSSGCELVSTVIDMRSDYPVLTVLVNSSGTRLFVQGRDSAQVWTMSGSKTDTKFDLRSSDDSTFLNHPLQPDVFLSISPNHTAAYTWDDSKENDTTARQGTHDSTSPDVAHLTTPQKHVAILSTSHDSTEKNHPYELKIWDASQISTNGDFPDPLALPDFEHISANMRQIIHVDKSLMIFLDKDLWICSVDITQWAAHKQGAKRHFFLLSEWKGSTHDFLIEYIPLRREFAIVRKHDILIIRRGLDVGTPLD